jgi:hypothetical protein
MEDSCRAKMGILNPGKGDIKMKTETGLTDGFTGISTTTKTDSTSDDGKIIHGNFEILQNEFPKLGIKQDGPVIIIYRYTSDSDGNNMVQSEIETVYPILKESKVSIPSNSRIALREFKQVKCVKYQFKGPVWETPWGDLIKNVRATGVKKVFETREVYKLFKGGASKDNEIEMQIITE